MKQEIAPFDTFKRTYFDFGGIEFGWCMVHKIREYMHLDYQDYKTISTTSDNIKFFMSCLVVKDHFYKFVRDCDALDDDLKTPIWVTKAAEYVRHIKNLLRFVEEDEIDSKTLYFRSHIFELVERALDVLAGYLKPGFDGSPKSSTEIYQIFRLAYHFDPRIDAVLALNLPHEIKEHIAMFICDSILNEIFSYYEFLYISGIPVRLCDNFCNVQLKKKIISIIHHGSSKEVIVSEEF